MVVVVVVVVFEKWEFQLQPRFFRHQDAPVVWLINVGKFPIAQICSSILRSANLLET